MQKLNVSTEKIDKFAGKWVVIDPQKDLIIAAGKTLDEIGDLVIHPKSEKRESGKTPAAFKVPRKDEGPYVL